MKIRLTTFARPDRELLKRFSLRYLSVKTTWKDLCPFNLIWMAVHEREIRSLYKMN